MLSNTNLVQNITLLLISIKLGEAKPLNLYSSEGKSGDGGHSGSSASDEAASSTVVEGAVVEELDLSGGASREGLVVVLSSSELHEILNFSKLGGADGLDLLHDGPLDTLSARRSGKGTLVAPEVTHVDVTEEGTDANVSLKS